MKKSASQFSAKLRHAWREYKRYTFRKDLRATRFSNIFKVAAIDGRRIFSSVVVLVMLFGLCVVPCLYAWFNIFSNWDPYGPDATSRIRVAVVSEDEGADLFGLHLNVGEQVISGLESNDTIGWIFVDTVDEALDRVCRGDCYAAIVVPESFSENTVSFLTLDFDHPELMYYENAKKNAIAPKITGKAKTAVQETVNATIVETIAGDVAKVFGVLSENGVDYATTVQNLADKTDELKEKLTNVEALLTSTIALSNATQQLMYYSSITAMHTANTAHSAGNTFYTISQDTAGISSFLQKNDAQTVATLEDTDRQLAEMSAELTKMQADMSGYIDSYGTIMTMYSDNSFLLAQRCQQQGSASIAMLNLVNSLGYLGNDFATASGVNPLETDAVNEQLTALQARIAECRGHIGSSLNELSSTVEEMLASAYKNIGVVAADLQAAFDGFGVKSDNLSASLSSLIEPLSTLEAGLIDARENVQNGIEKLDEVKETLDALAKSDFLKRLTGTLEDDSEIVGTYFASPITMETDVLYPIENYGSAMAPFYTVLAQWVGALFCICLLKTHVEIDGLEKPLTMHEKFFGRMILFLVCGLIQAIVVSLGNLWYVGIYAAHPVRLVIATIVVGISFTLINYSLLFSLQNIGLGASVIVMVIQVAGSGGSYPVQVVPKVFQIVYPFMPFNYAMNAMREAIGGCYGNYYIKDLAILMLMGVIVLIVCQFLYYPAHRLNVIIRNSMKKSEIMTY